MDVFDEFVINYKRDKECEYQAQLVVCARELGKLVWCVPSHIDEGMQRQISRGVNDAIDKVRVLGCLI